MRFFEWFYRDRITGGYADSKQTEWFVTCPFPHHEQTGEQYFEKRPSANINLDKNVFWCHVCGEGCSEPVFMQKVFEQKGCTIDYHQALEILEFMEKEPIIDDYQSMKEGLKSQPDYLKLIDQLGISSVVDKLQLGYLPRVDKQSDGITFPVHVFGKIRDVRRYNPKAKFKVKGMKGSTCLAFPFDIWVDEDPSEPTLLVEGEKDTAIGRAMGLRTLSFTNGCKAFPHLLKPFFAGQTFYICYDNDKSGREGAEKMGVELIEAGAIVYIVDISQVCKEDKEDLWDFFMKYKKSPNDLKDLMKKAPKFTGQLFEKARSKKYPLVKLQESSQGKYTKKILSSHVVIAGSYENMYKVPDRCILELYNEKDELMDRMEWSLYKDRSHLLHLIDVSNENQKKFFNRFMKKGVRDRVRVIPLSYKEVFKYMVSDNLEFEVIEEEKAEHAKSYKPFEMDLYVLGKPLNDGEKYLIMYEPSIKPSNQSVCCLLHKAEPAQTSVESFKITPSVKETLKCFQGNVLKKMKENHERAKGLVAPYLTKDIFEPIELFFHTPLKFKFSGRSHRAYLDCMIVGESRTGKSSTAKALINTYQLGTFVSLPTATPEALIGGSHGTSSKGYQIRMGVLPRHNKGAIILEEFSSFGQKVIRKLTEIRSSNTVRIDRVSGSQVAPAWVRMLTLTNQKPQPDKRTIPLNQYSSGVEIVSELVGTSEDIARYDFFRLIEKPKKEIPENTPIKIPPYPIESYQNRIRWIWSRSADQIIISPQVEQLIINWSSELNEKYGSHIQFFGTETWKKLSRVAIAVAATVVSTDESFEKVIVKEDHVAYAYNFLVDCYDNDLFRLREYVEDERRYETCDQVTIGIVQGFKDKFPTVFNMFDRGTTFTLRNLEAFSGLERDELNTLIRSLVESCLIRMDNYSIVPSQRYRIASRKLKGKSQRAKKIWEG